MPVNGDEVGTERYSAREAVGVFDDADALEAAIDALEAAAFDRAEISVLASEEILRSRIGALYGSVAQIKDDAWGADADGAPLFIGGVAGGFALVASGGAVAPAVGGRTEGASVGDILARLVSRRHAEPIEERLARGGLALWVSVRDDQTSVRALELLIKAGARDAHEIQIQREWTPAKPPSSRIRSDFVV